MLKGKLEVDFTFSLYLIKIFSVLLDHFQRQRIRDAEVTAAQTFMSDCCNGNISFAAASLSSSAHISPRVQILIKNNSFYYNTLHDEILYIKGQLISKCLYGVIVWTKNQRNFFPGFLPLPLKRGCDKNFFIPIMVKKH